VRIEVSTGKPPAAEVPGTIGMPEGAASASIEAAGFVVDVTYQQVEDRSKAGKVLRQDPPAGTPAPEGSVVTIVVGRRGG
jgi:beta-lactam-binding protein with PASTA domain